jgi:drug/metabolite transporter (DMT)-like permease
MSNGGGVGVGTSRSPVMDAAAVPPRSPRLQPDAVDIERQPILETTQLEVPARGRMLKSSSVIFGGGPINFTFPTWIMTLTIIISWYASNTGLLILNKWLLSTYGFRKPVFLTLCHMLACSAMGAGASAARIVPPQPIKSPEQFRKIAGLAVVFCLSVVLGNVALRFIPVSFSQAIGATTPVFTAVLAVAMMGKRETGIVYAALLPVVIGIVIATGAEPLFDMAGFSAAVIATAMRALKSVLQGMLLMDASEKMDSLNLLRWMAPIASLCLIPAVLVLEPTVIREAMEMGVQQPNFLWLLAFNAFLAYFTNLTNFLVTRYTSALTLQVLGNAKGVFTTALSIFIFRNPFTVTSVGGYLITVAGVGCYAAAKRYQTAQKTSLTSTRD